jgi:DNA repair protein RecO (recombination protein O)
MPESNTPALLLRRRAYGDYDFIVTLFTRHYGKITAIAKNARRSRQRFAGTLEMFAFSSATFSSGRRKGMALLQETHLQQPFDCIRESLLCTAYASYWVELVELWLEERCPHVQLFKLLLDLLTQLDAQPCDCDILNLQFQLKFLQLAGLTPDLYHCQQCRRSILSNATERIGFNIAAGGLICPACQSGNEREHLLLTAGTLKHLIWIQEKTVKHGRRLKMIPSAMTAAKQLLETFVPYHLGRRIKSLEFLQKIRISVSGDC